MNKVRDILFLYAISILLYACNEGENKNDTILKLQIDPEVIDSPIRLSDVAETTVIPLLTSDTVLIGEISHVYTTDKQIYVSDISTVFQFSSQGEFVSRICRRGDAPDEYLNISDFQVTPEGDVWILCRNTRTLYLYSWDNRLKRKLPVDLWVENIRLSGNHMWLYTGNEKSDDKYTQLHFLDLTKGKVINHFKAANEHQAQYLFVKNANLFSCGENDTIGRFFQLFNDTVYRITPHTATPEYVCDWNGKNIPASFYERNYGNVMDFFQHLRPNDYAYGIHSFAESETTLGITYYYQGKCYCSIIPKDGVNTPVTFHQFRVSGPTGEYDMNLSEVSVFSQDNGEWVISMDLPDSANPSNPAVDDSNPALLIVKLP